jgi:hypothetical protein
MFAYDKSGTICLLGLELQPKAEPTWQLKPLSQRLRAFNKGFAPLMHLLPPVLVVVPLSKPVLSAPAALRYPCPCFRLDSDFCPGSLWVADQRFAWFDLTANLTFYGPGPGGKGQVGTWARW